MRKKARGVETIRCNELGLFLFYLWIKRNRKYSFGQLWSSEWVMGGVFEQKGVLKCNIKVAKKYKNQVKVTLNFSDSPREHFIVD